MWNGKRLLSRRYLREAVAPSATNGCYGWLIWVNAGKPCISPRITERGIDDAREFPGLPHDLYNFSGLFGQIVTVMPTQDVEVVRLGQDRGLVFAGGTSWEQQLYEGVLASITDTKVEPSGDAPAVGSAAREDSDGGFQNAISHPERYQQGAQQEPLPAAGPERSRALRLRLAHTRVGRRGRVTLRATCPAKAKAPCKGTATLQSADGPVQYWLERGETMYLRFDLTRAAQRALRRRGGATLEARATNESTGVPTVATLSVAVRR